MRFRTRVAAAAIAVPLALGLAACGGADKKEATGTLPTPVTSSSPTAPATTAPLKAAPVAHLNRVTFVPAMNAAFGKQKTWRTVATMTAEGRTVMTMSGYQQAKPLAASLEMSGLAFQGKTAKMVVVGGMLYMSMPGVSPAGKFLKVDLKNTPGAENFSELLNGGDPTKTFEAFGKGLQTVKFVRSETVDGVKLDRYQVSVNTAAVLKLQGKKLPAGAPKTLPYTVWMGPDHLVRKMTFNLQGVSMVMTMSEYNHPVSIKAPPASKIVKR
ncbi:uncharacterized protein DUF1396 [Kribbella voronezhensis]|uniref:Uncharacterized protein DUF1396 n=1 Tax=Kribbella voronezhensis TaxID=2512212 RepID=A0A4V3FKG9_9ACTN|nr:LppX_LprAFG lipoprotein [Kribbella voronezhensis]TDU90173.1 uncharacterized protein DUF1396 [Kribbella voronezhensis]